MLNCEMLVHMLKTNCTPPTSCGAYSKSGNFKGVNSLICLVHPHWFLVPNMIGIRLETRVKRRLFLPLCVPQEKTKPTLSFLQLRALEKGLVLIPRLFWKSCVKLLLLFSLFQRFPTCFIPNCFQKHLVDGLLWKERVEKAVQRILARNFWEKINF